MFYQGSEPYVFNNKIKAYQVDKSPDFVLVNHCK